MSSREEARQDVENLRREHDAKIKRMELAQDDALSRFKQDLGNLTESYNQAHQSLNEKSAAHEISMNQLRAAEDEKNKADAAAHQQNVKDLISSLNQRLDDLRLSAAQAEKDQMKYNSEQKREMELARQELAKDITDTIKREMDATAAAQKIADEQSKERDEMRFKTEKEHIEDLKQMQNTLLAMAAAERERLEDHAKKMQSLHYTEVTQKIKMNQAEMKMGDKRTAYELVDEIGGEVNKIVRKFKDVSTQIGMSVKYQKPQMLKLQQVGIQRSIEAMKTAVSVALELLERLIITAIDHQDAARQEIAKIVKADMEEVYTFHSEVVTGFTMLEYADPYDVLDGLMKSLQVMERTVNSIKNSWDMLPPVDRTNLVYAQFLETSEIVLRGGPLAINEDDMKLALEAAQN